MIDLFHHFCSNLECEDQDVRGKLNITTSTRYRKNDTYRCSARFFIKCFSRIVKQFLYFLIINKTRENGKVVKIKRNIISGDSKFIDQTV